MLATTALNRLSMLGSRLRQTADSVNASSVAQQYKVHAEYYALLRSYYRGSVYERSDANVAAIKQWEGLPRYIRPITMIPRRAVEWWPGHLFPGTWTWDGLSASNGRPNMIAYDQDTPEEIRIAVQQGFTWGNGPRLLRRMGRTGPMLGNVFMKIHVDAERQKVYPLMVDPEHVVEIEFNAAGDVTMYRLAIPQWDEDANRSYFYGERGTRDSVTTYYDDREHSYVDGQPAQIDNEYGFVPAIFPPHVDTGGTHGASAIDGTLALLDELNGMISQVDDYIMRIVNQHVVIESPNPAALQRLLDQSAATTKTPTADRADYHAGRQETKALAAPVGTAVHHLLQDIGLSASDPHIQRLEREVEKTFPEIVLSDKLLEMSQVTRPGAIPLVQDVQHKYDESAGNYYDGVVAAGQMMCSIGGHLARSGAWGRRRDLTPQQQKFLAFDLSSYDKGDLDFGIVPGELIPKSFLELANEAIAIESVRTAAGFEHMGFSEDEIYGEGNVPSQAPGLLEQRQGASQSAAQAFGQAFGQGA